MNSAEILVPCGFRLGICIVPVMADANSNSYPTRRFFITPCRDAGRSSGFAHINYCAPSKPKQSPVSGLLCKFVNQSGHLLLCPLHPPPVEELLLCVATSIPVCI